MAATITEKILANASGREQVSPGEIITAKVDAVIGHDITTAAFRELEKMEVEQVFDREKVYFTVDHFVPSPTLDAAAQLKDLSAYIAKYEIKHWFEQGRGGICHAIFPEQGLIRPGMVVVGSDSHTCTYGALGAFSSGLGATDVAAAMALGELWLKVPASIKFNFFGALPEMVTGKDLILHTIGRIGVDGARYKAMEFSGEAIRALPIDDRFTMCNMAVEAGAKNGIIEADQTALEYLAGRTRQPFLTFTSDRDAGYEAEHACDVARLEPMVAQPYSPANVAPAREITGVKLDQVVIGSCTNGRMTDLRTAAAILKGRKIAPGLRVIVIPATQEIFLQAMEEGLLKIFVEAEAVVSTPTCGPCLGGHMGILAAGERALATTNRNFVGRMGSPKSEVYLCGPAVAAASALTGRITHPDEVMK